MAVITYRSNNFWRRLMRKRMLIILLALVLILAVWWYLERPSHKTTLTIPTSSSTTGVQPSGASQSKNQSATNSSTSPSLPTKSSNIASTTTNTNQPLIDPWGNFVSNHKPGQDGSGTAETSVCNTTPGASCYIKFTNGSLTRTLDTKTADINGSIIWNWDVSSAGFTSGSWHISAVASLGDQTKTVNDSQALVIQ